MILLAIDSGVEKTGFAVFSRVNLHTGDPRLIASGLIKTDKKLPIQVRLSKIFDELTNIIKKYKPTIVVLEQLFFFRNQKTAIQVSQSQGIVLLLCAQFNIKVKYLTPLQIKQIITGYGQADKKSIQKMIKLSLGVTISSSRDDEADAIACGLAYCYLNMNLVE